jgi:hypothetical protein
LALLKQLVDQGHQIGALASFSDQQLQELASAAASGYPTVGTPVRAVLVGEGLARRLTAGDRATLLLNVRCKCPTLEDAVKLSVDGGVEVLVVEIPELHDTALSLIPKAREAVGALAVVVLYRFCASATIRQFRALGCIAARVPPDLSEIVMLCRAAVARQRSNQPCKTSDEPTPRRFDDEALVTLAASGTNIECECPRHLADILMMVGSFERYSAQCASRNMNDARLHQELGHAAVQARVVLEEAMQRLAYAEGLPLPIPSHVHPPSF